MGPQTRGIGRRTYLKLTGGSIAGAGLAGCTGDGDGDGGDDQVTLQVADFLPENHHIRRFSLLPWVERVEELTDGQVEFDLNFGGALGGSGEMLSMAREGIADITICPPAYFPGELPLGQVGNLPGTFLETEVACEAFWNLTNDMLYEEELRDLNLRPVFVTVEAPYQAGSLTGDPIVSLDDWDGLSVRSTGGIMSVTIESLGASPVEIAPEDIYSSAERGVVDAIPLGQASVEAYDLWEFYSHWSTNVNLGSWVAFWAMNHDTWDGLPESVQDALLTAAEEQAPMMGADYDEYHTGLHPDFEDRGIELYEVPEEEYSEWVDVMRDAAHGHWLDATEERGEPGQEVLDAWLSELEETR